MRLLAFAFTIVFVWTGPNMPRTGMNASTKIFPFERCILHVYSLQIAVAVG